MLNGREPEKLDRLVVEKMNIISMREIELLRSTSGKIPAKGYLILSYLNCGGMTSTIWK